MSLTTEQLAYSQQKNREYIWEQCRVEFKEKFGIFNPDSLVDEDWLDNRYLELCSQANITPW